MKKIDYDKLYDALELIKSICEDQRTCSQCPLGNRDGGCELASKAPKYYGTRHPETDVFRVLE